MPLPGAASYSTDDHPCWIVFGAAMEIEGIAFPAAVRLPWSSNDFLLGGAGVRGLDIQGRFVKFTAIAVYLQPAVVPHLALKWKGFSAHQLNTNHDFFADVVSCPYEKFVRVALIEPLTGKEYSEKVSEGLRRAWEGRDRDIYGPAEAQALQQFNDTFGPRSFPAGSAILFTVSPAGLVIAFSEGGSAIPEKAAAVIENRALGEGVLASIIGKNGVSPAAKASLAERISNLYLCEPNHWVATTNAGSVICGLEVEGVTFPAKVTPPGSAKEVILGGAGFRGLQIDGKFIKFTTIGVYIEEPIISHLARRWKGKTAQELNDCTDFFMDVVTCPYVKFTRIALIAPLTGIDYSEKVSEGCKAAWEAAGMYGTDEAKALQQFREIFKDRHFPPGSSILFTVSPAGLGIAFSEDGSIPGEALAIIENRVLAEGVLASILGKHGVSPAAKASLAQRISKLLSEK